MTSTDLKWNLKYLVVANSNVNYLCNTCKVKHNYQKILHPTLKNFTTSSLSNHMQEVQRDNRETRHALNTPALLNAVKKQ